MPKEHWLIRPVDDSSMESSFYGTTDPSSTRMAKQLMYGVAESRARAEMKKKKEEQ